MEATSALSASRARGAAFICAAIDAQCAAAATATCGDAAAAAAGKACDLQKVRSADSFIGRRSSAAAAAVAPCSANRPKYADSPSASSAAGATRVAVAPAAAADLLTFSTFSFGHAARSSSTTVLTAISPSVGALLLPPSSDPSPSAPVAFLDFLDVLFDEGLTVPAASDPGARAATSAATKSNAARRAVTPPPLDPSSASSAASSSAASPHACTLAYSSGSSASISRSASVRDTCGTTHSRTNAERRAVRDASSSGPSAVVVVVVVVSAAYAPASPHSTTAASVANAAAAAGGLATPGASDATRLAAPTIASSDAPSSDAACLDTSAAPSRIPRFVAIHAVSWTFSGFVSAADATARATASIAPATSPSDDRSASGMCARTRR